MGLNPTPLADGYPLLYLDEWPNDGAISNRATIEIDWLYDGDVLTKLNADNPRMPDFGRDAGGLP